MSAKKDGMVNMGGFIALRDDTWIDGVRNGLIMAEGYPTYGGLAGRDLEAMAVGLEEGMQEDYLRYRLRTAEYWGNGWRRRASASSNPRAATRSTSTPERCCRRCPWLTIRLGPVQRAVPGRRHPGRGNRLGDVRQAAGRWHRDLPPDGARAPGISAPHVHAVALRLRRRGDRRRQAKGRRHPRCGASPSSRPSCVTSPASAPGSTPDADLPSIESDFRTQVTGAGLKSTSELCSCQCSARSSCAHWPRRA